MTQMTLDEAIRHTEEVVERLETSCKRDWMGEDDERCASEHRQLVEWLKDYKRLLEQTSCDDCISRQVAVDTINALHEKPNAWLDLAVDAVMALPSAIPRQKIGYWIRWYERKETEQYRENIPHCNCSECGKEYDPHSSQFIKFCSNCGAKMQEA